MTITAKYPGRCRKCGGAIAVGNQIDWERGSGAAHVSCPTKSQSAPEISNPNEIKISGGSGYGHHGWTPGQVINHRITRERKKGEVLPGENPETLNRYWVLEGYQLITVIKAGKNYYREDGMSFGVGDECGYVYWASCRPSTQEEIDSYLLSMMPSAQAENAKREVAKIAEQIKSEGEYPTGKNTPEGFRVVDTQDAYGAGSWFVVGGDWIWYVKNNGMDGDDWSRNNVVTGGAGAIGWKIPHDQKIMDRLTECDINLKGGKR